MAQIPPFARALQSRRAAASNMGAPPSRKRYEPEPFNFGLDSFSAQDRPDSASVSVSQSPKEQDYIDEIKDLRTVIQDLEQQVAELTAETKRLQRIETEVETTRQLSADWQRQVEDLTTQLEDEKSKTKYMTEQIQQLEGLLDSKRHLTEAKEQMVQRMQTEYQQVMDDYQRLLDLNGVQTGQLRQAKVQISELEAQVEEMRNAQRARQTHIYQPEQPRMPPVVDDFAFKPPTFEEKPFFDPVPPTDFDTPANFMPPLPPEDDLPVINEPAPAPMAIIPSPKRTALVDNIKFGYEEPAAAESIVDDTDNMTVPEMKQQLDILRQQKEEVERKLNKAPPKGRPMSHVRREQEEYEVELNAIVKRISKIRFTLRKLHAL